MLLFFAMAHINRMACWLSDFLVLGKIEMMPSRTLLFHPFLLSDSECTKHDWFELIMCQSHKFGWEELYANFNMSHSQIAA